MGVRRVENGWKKERGSEGEIGREREGGKEERRGEGREERREGGREGGREREKERESETKEPYLAYLGGRRTASDMTCRPQASLSGRTLLFSRRRCMRLRLQGGTSGGEHGESGRERYQFPRIYATLE